MATLIFDFDGTIADSMSVIIGLFSEIMHRPTPAHAEIQRLKQLPTAQVIRELRIPLWRVPMLLGRGRKLMASRMAEIEPFDGMPEALKTLHGQGHHMIIVSSNSARNVRAFLEAHQLDDYFARVYGGAGLAGKASTLRKIIRQNHIEKAKALYIGDEVRDGEAAAQVGIRNVAVTWGFNDRRALAAQHPFALANSPAELVSCITPLKDETYNA